MDDLVNVLLGIYKTHTAPQGSAEGVITTDLPDFCSNSGLIKRVSPKVKSDILNISHLHVNGLLVCVQECC